MIHRWQLWFEGDGEEKRFFYICGMNEGWVYYVPLNLIGLHRRVFYEQAWKKAKIEHFERKYTFSRHAIAPKSFWKKKATGQPVQVLDVKDDGWKKVYVMYDLEKISIYDFFDYFEPCGRVEILILMAKEKQTLKRIEKIKNRIKMVGARTF